MTRPAGMATSTETGGIDLHVQPDPFHGMGRHHRSGNLAHIGAKIDRGALLFVRQRAIKQSQGFNPPGKPCKPFAFLILLSIARLHSDERRDHLKIVLHAMLKFPQQDIFLRQQFAEALGGRRRLIAGSKGHQTEKRGVIIVDDGIRPDIDDDGVLGFGHE